MVKLSNLRSNNSVLLKNCNYCKKDFSQTDFPGTFYRMVTCGKQECTRLRRIEKWKTRYTHWKVNRIDPEKRKIVHKGLKEQLSLVSWLP